MFTKFLAIFLIIFGEFLTIYAEIFGAKLVSLSEPGKLVNWITPVLLVVVGSLALLSGYVVGILGFKDIWIVTAISVTAILVAEPVLAYYFFQTPPSMNALIGFSLGGLGLVITLWE